MPLKGKESPPGGDVARPFLLLLLLSGCAHLPGLIPETGTAEYPRQCVSACGSKVFAPPGVMSGCARYEEIEAGVVRSFPAGTCARLKNVIVTVQPTDKWPDPWGRTFPDGVTTVGGVTYCDRNSMQVGKSLAGLAHEVAHLRECPVSDVEHKRWTPEIWRAIDAANASGVSP